VAIALVFRVAIQLGAAAYRICAGPTLDPGTCANRLRAAWDVLSDPLHSADDAADALNGGAAPEEGLWFVTDFLEPFELRKLQFRMSRKPGSRIEDVDVMTFHFIKATGGVVGSWADSTDLPALEGAFNTFIGNLTGQWHSFLHADQYRWYKDGPAFYHSDPTKPYFQPNGDNAAIRITEIDVAGTAATSSAMPPQCALTITERTSSRRHWGRFYIPFTSTGITDNTGLLSSGYVTQYLTAAVTLYNACRVLHAVPVVFSVAKNERPKKPSGVLPAQGAIAYEVLSLQMDDIVDIIRTRRWAGGLNKTNTALT